MVQQLLHWYLCLFAQNISICGFEQNTVLGSQIVVGWLEGKLGAPAGMLANPTVDYRLLHTLKPTTTTAVVFLVLQELQFALEKKAVSVTLTGLVLVPSHVPGRLIHTANIDLPPTSPNLLLDL